MIRVAVDLEPIPGTLGMSLKYTHLHVRALTDVVHSPVCFWKTTKPPMSNHPGHPCRRRVTLHTDMNTLDTHSNNTQKWLKGRKWLFCNGHLSLLTWALSNKVQDPNLSVSNLVIPYIKGFFFIAGLRKILKMRCLREVLMFGNV